MRKRIAVIGTGIAGLGAAWALHDDHDLEVFEAASRVGGHSNTVSVSTPSGEISVDTGFIVYNEVTYPNLTRLFAELDVKTQWSDMSFSYSETGGIEYGASVSGILARPTNLVRPGFLTMLRDINRFRRFGQHLDPHSGESLDELLVRYGFSKGFRTNYLYPMTGAIWSTALEHIGSYPAEAILTFLRNHGLIEIVGRPRWRTVTGGSQNYVNRLIAPFEERIRLDTPVLSLVRSGDSVSVVTPSGTETFDEVVLATHSDEALRILGDEATREERMLLGSIPYSPNSVVLHGDPTLMPRNRRIWSSWNAMSDPATRERPSVTYWMNRLQDLDMATPLFVSLNPHRQPRLDRVYAAFEYSHPQFDLRSVNAQKRIADIQGDNNTWFAGAYLGYGFHEDGLQSGLNVATALGSPPPWQGTFEPISSALMRTRAQVLA